MCTISPKLLIEVVADFRNRHSQAELEVVDGTADVLERKLLEAEIDIAVFARPKRRPNSRLNYLRLFREQMMIVVPKAHRFAAMPKVRVSDLHSENYVMRALCEFGEPAESPDEETVSWRSAYRSDRDDWVFAMVASGFGFAFVPRYSVPIHENFEIIPLTEPEFWRQVNLVTVLDRPHTPAVGALVHEFAKRNWPRE
jgi:DNA-binding transcriptional LysR family regulator